MKQHNSVVEISGIGVVSPIGIGVDYFTLGLKNGMTNFSEISFEQNEQIFSYPIAVTNNFEFKKDIEHLSLDADIIAKAKRVRHISKSASYGLYSVLEAWTDSGLSEADVDPSKIAIVSCGSNTQQTTLVETQEKYAKKLQYLNPNYGLNFFDSDIVGIASELLGIQGEGYSLGAASASGNMGIIQGCRLIRSGEYDVVVVVAPLMDISRYEYQGFTSIGAMCKTKGKEIIEDLYRPFDAKHDGFVYGQMSGCIILESESHLRKRKKKKLAAISGYGVNLDGNRNPNPSQEGEYNAMQKAINDAGITPVDIDYINAHGSGSVIGDKTEVEALRQVGLSGKKVNSTKSLIGHGLSAAGLIETIATVIQLEEQFLHISNNLSNPISDDMDWLIKTEETAINYAINNSFGFGGVNTSIVIKK
ncbi:beta-ketoacyl synthase N-terminal-like domain-containing protein [Aquimarina aggregata]|uniref:beta-ketoacyl synthase N-terminal-like domain-containing protein n=1 Tax=Aquimarina aggregata TaxID=1642818 RepID=UPI00248F81B7|nr:beta-ketoacyl synthase N-terminal-like domain-containing protein [Aquimarina aggregata]